MVLPLPLPLQPQMRLLLLLLQQANQVQQSQDSCLPSQNLPS